MWWIKNKRKLIVFALIVAVLTAAFWYGGDSGGMRGWSAKETAEKTELQTELTSAPGTAETPQPTTAPTQPPEVPETAEIAETPSALTEKHCTISISCSSVIDHMDWLTPAKAALVPENGWILGSADMVFTEGESVFDVLLRVCTEQKIHMEFPKHLCIRAPILRELETSMSLTAATCPAGCIASTDASPITAAHSTRLLTAT